MWAIRNQIAAVEMITHGLTQQIGNFKPLYFVSSPRLPLRLENHSPRHFSPRNTLPFPLLASLRRDSSFDAEAQHEPRRILSGSRREVLLLPSLAAAAGLLHSIAAARAEEKPPQPSSDTAVVDTREEKKEKSEEGEAAIVSRVYDATVIGEPLAVGKDKRRVWEKLMGARIVYLGEAELVPDRDDRVLELEILKNLRSRCLEQQRSISVALEAFPCDLQEQLNQFMDGRSVLCSYVLFLFSGLNMHALHDSSDHVILGKRVLGKKIILYEMFWYFFICINFLNQVYYLLTGLTAKA